MNHSAAIAELRHVMERLEPEPEHTAHVAFLAVRLFDQLASLHGLGPDERVLLEGAAWLHDVGWPVSKGGSGHHKLSARLIRRQKWKYLSRVEIDTVALVARYHRKALPCSEHVDFHSLDERRQNAIRQMSAILRVADALDRSHLQYVRDVRVRIDPLYLELILVTREPPAREMAGVERKGNLARQIFGREFTFRIESPE